MKKKYVFNVVISVSGLALMTLISVLLSFFLSYVFSDPITFLLRTAITNSIFLGGVVLLTHYITNILTFRLRNSLLLLLAFGMILGAGVLYFTIQVVLSPLAFMYMDNRTVMFLFVNLLFYIAINLVVSGSLIFQKTISAKEAALNEEKYLKKRIELKLLSSKLNPHFLFNSLNLIVSLLKQPDKAEEAILNLSDLLRYNLETTDRELIEIGDELSNIEKYLSLQKTRFEDRLDYHIHCDTNGRIPPFIIQPLVENCIKHNLDEVSHLTIWITVTRIGKKLQIGVMDSRKILRPDMLNKGQGLTITKSRVESLGGQFLVNNGGIELIFIS